MFALKVMAIVFSTLSIIKTLPGINIRDRSTSLSCGLISALLATFIVGMCILSIDEILLYPLMIVSVTLSVAGWAISSVNDNFR